MSYNSLHLLKSWYIFSYICIVYKLIEKYKSWNLVSTNFNNIRWVVLKIDQKSNLKHLLGNFECDNFADSATLNEIYILIY